MTMRLEDLKGDSCLWCGEDIDLSRPFAITRVYCSAECRLAYRNDVDRRTRIEAKQGRQCKQCGAPIPVTRRIDSDCCSDKCSQAYNRADQAKRYPLACQQCGAQFFGHYARQKYCSSTCYGAGHSAIRKAKRGSAACAHCSTVFDRRYPTQRFCSVAWAAGYRQQRAKEKLDRVCIDCSAVFKVTRIDTAGLRCPICRHKHSAANLRLRRHITCEAVS